MSANVETMFYTRTAPWHGLGVKVSHALTAREALLAAGLNWKVVQRPLFTDSQILVEGFKANVRSSDNKVLGVVSDRYKVVQNEEAFAFTDELFGQGVRYETAGSLQEGRKTWVLAKLPNEYIVRGDRISPFLVFSNSHDGSGSIKVALTPIRVVCQNTLNLALQTAQRSWSTKHTGDIQYRLEDAKETLFMAEEYMDKLGSEIEILSRIKITDEKVTDFINELLPVTSEATNLQERNVQKQRDDIAFRYHTAPDLMSIEKNGYRFVNAVSDFATHAKPLRETASYREKVFSKTIDGNTLIDKAYQLVKTVA